MVLTAVHIRFADKTAVSAVRREKAAAFANEDDRRRSLCAGMALDACLRTVGLRECDQQIVCDRYGKPHLKDHPEWQFSLSHSGEYAVCVLDDAPIGVDLEQVRDVDVARFAGRCPAVSADLSPKAFFETWTRQESFLKLIGRGLSALRTVPDPDCRFFQYTWDGYCLTVCSKTAITAPTLLFYDGNDLPR